MPKIVWSKKWEQMTESLHSGVSVRDTAKAIGVSYSSLCKYLATLSMDNTGKFKDRIKSDSENLQQYWEKFVLKKYDQIPLIMEAFGMSPGQVQGLMRQYNLRKEWNFKDSTSREVAFGRKAELWVASRDEFHVLRDMIKTNSKSDYDLVLVSWGAVDVKATRCQSTPSGGHRYKFNTANVAKPTRHVFLVGYDAEGENPEVFLILPYKEVKGKQSISISKEKLEESKYFQFLHWRANREEVSEQDT